MTQTLTRDVQNLLARQIAEGNYQSFDEALAALRDVVADRDVLDEMRALWLKNQMAEGEASGGEIPAEDVFRAARARIAR